MKSERKTIVILLSMIFLVVLFFLMIQEKPVCQENWSCNDWGTCSNNQQTRVCNDLNKCGTVLNKPAVTQSCVICTPKWSCTSWSTCVSSFQTRSCTDSNKCNVLTDKPITSQSCTIPIPEPEPVKFETNALGGYDSYKSGTWIKLDSNNDGKLEQYNYIGTITGGSCLGSLFLTTPDGLVITKYESYFYVCSPSIGYKRYRSI